MIKGTEHSGQLIPLRRIEGQIRGIQKMIEEKRYCVDIVTQLHSIIGAILSVEDNIISKHLQECVVKGFKEGNPVEQKQKIDEIIGLLKRFRK